MNINSGRRRNSDVFGTFLKATKQSQINREYPELKAENKQLKKDNAQLRARIEQLEARLFDGRVDTTA